MSMCCKVENDSASRLVCLLEDEDIHGNIWQNNLSICDNSSISIESTL